MVLGNFLKKVFGSKVSTEEKGEGEDSSISLSNLENDFYHEKSRFSDEEKQVVSRIRSSIGDSKKGGMEKLEILEQVDVDSKNVEQRAKLIVKENLENYVSLYKKLFQDLESIGTTSLDSFLKEADKALKEFESKSYTNFQKASFLFEKKIKDANSKVVEISNFLKQVSKENSSLIEKSRAFSVVNSKLQEIKDLKKKLEDSKSGIDSIEGKLEQKKEETDKISKDLEKVKVNDAYKRNESREEKASRIKEEINSDLKGLKESIDFKSLGNAFHKDENKIQAVKAHKENFFSRFREDKGDSLEMLLGSLNRSDLVSKIESIRNKMKEVHEIEKSFEDSGYESLNSSKDRLDSEVESLKAEKSKENKNYERLSEKINSLKQECAQALREAGFNVID